MTKKERLFLSKHNIMSKVRDSEDYYIINLLSRNADIISNADANALNILDFSSLSDIDAYIEKGYLLHDLNDEDKEFKRAYIDFIHDRDQSETQIFFVPSYACNFSCSYCYQNGYQSIHRSLNNEIINLFFEYIERFDKKYITLFGGEPLLPSKENKTNIEYIIQKASEKNIGIAIVTNGYSILEYMDVIQKGIIREIQVTLDGPEAVHNKRRSLKDGGATFSKIVEGIDALLKVNIPVNLRVVVDKENINSLPELAEFAVRQGWTKNPLFKTQLGRNYELHFCQQHNNKLFDRLSLYEDLYQLIKKYPVIPQFHRPSYSISKFLFDNGELPEPLFDSCPACKTEWAFDYTGSIYSCTATVGKEDEKLGTFYPKVYLNTDLVEQWEDRDVLSIPDCKHCKLNLACGGGCGSAAKNKNGGLHTPDCRPIKELLEIGMKLYF
ncbi:MAG: hypothetical protein A2Y40_03115 [Candidatus Margulisbacteria bacterium GWF2_35_9]|nr:MAG: hypothetical protein A2Y40_03115 [Candidatus Margulisbacteria bacterium GWF2_35_9]